MYVCGWVGREQTLNPKPKWTNGFRLHSSPKSWIVLYFCYIFLPCLLSHWLWVGSFFGQISFWQYPNGQKSKLSNNHWFAGNTFIIYVITFTVNIFILLILFQHPPDMFHCFSLFQRQMGHMGLSRRAWHGRKMHIDGFCKVQACNAFYLTKYFACKAFALKSKSFHRPKRAPAPIYSTRKGHATKTMHGSSPIFFLSFGRTNKKNNCLNKHLCCTQGKHYKETAQMIAKY